MENLNEDWTTHMDSTLSLARKRPNVCARTRQRGMMSEESILQEADRIINGERRESYGGVLESFDRIARLWEPVLGVEVSAEQVGLCLIQLKVARYLHGQQRDSIVDIAGYAGCLEKMAQDRAVLEIEDETRNDG